MKKDKEDDFTSEFRKAMILTTALAGGIYVAEKALPDQEPVAKTVDVPKSAEQKIMEAAVLGDVDTFVKLLGEGADVNYQDLNTGKTVLMTAMENNSSIMHQGRAVEMVKEAILSKKVDLTLQDSRGCTLEDYVQSTIENLNREASMYVTPQTYAAGRAAEKLSERWQEVLEQIRKVNEKEAKTSAKKTNFHAFYKAREMNKS